MYAAYLIRGRIRQANEILKSLRIVQQEVSGLVIPKCSNHRSTIVHRLWTRARPFRLPGMLHPLRPDDAVSRFLPYANQQISAEKATLLRLGDRQIIVPEKIAPRPLGLCNDQIRQAHGLGALNVELG